LVILISKESYINLAVSRTNQLQTIIRPFIKLEDQWKFASDLGQAHSKKEFEAVYIKMKSIADSNGLKYPDFKPW
jgi:hypothetical protein